MPDDKDIKDKISERKWHAATIVAVVISLLTVANNFNVFGGYFVTASGQARHVEKQASRDAKQDEMIKRSVKEMQTYVSDSNKVTDTRIVELQNSLHEAQTNMAVLIERLDQLNKRLDEQNHRRNYYRTHPDRSQ